MHSKSPRASTSRPQLFTQATSRLPATNQSRIKQRMSSSPLKFPLENAINKAMMPRDNTSEKYSQSRILVKSRLKDERDNSVSRVISRTLYKDQPEYFRDKMHTETCTFLKKYFSMNAQSLPLEPFIECVIREYEHLWGTKNSVQIFDDFNYKIFELFGESISTRELAKKTLADGMIGLILEIFKQIKNEQKIRASNYLTVSKSPKIVTLKQSFEEQLVTGESLQNIKNIVQQFMQTMYQCMESEIYNKFNVEMRRMVVKYRQAQRIMKKVNQKINTHADVFEYQSQFKAKKREYEQAIEVLKKQIQELERELYRERSNCEMERRQNYKLEQENKKIKQNLQKFQNAVLTKVMEPNSYMDTTLSRKISSNSMIGDKQNVLPPNQQPFQITIDTHVIHKDGEPPETKTYATVHGLPNLGKSTVPELSNAPHTESRIVESTQMTPYSAYLAGDSSYCRLSPINQLSRRL